MSVDLQAGAAPVIHQEQVDAGVARSMAQADGVSVAAVAGEGRRGITDRFDDARRATAALDRRPAGLQDRRQGDAVALGVATFPVQRSDARDDAAAFSSSWLHPPENWSLRETRRGLTECGCGPAAPHAAKRTSVQAPQLGRHVRFIGEHRLGIPAAVIRPPS